MGKGIMAPVLLRRNHESKAHRPGQFSMRRYVLQNRLALPCKVTLKVSAIPFVQFLRCGGGYWSLVVRY